MHQQPSARLRAGSRKACHALFLVGRSRRRATMHTTCVVDMCVCESILFSTLPSFQCLWLKYQLPSPPLSLLLLPSLSPTLFQHLQNCCMKECDRLFGLPIIAQDRVFYSAATAAFVFHLVQNFKSIRAKDSFRKVFCLKVFLSPPSL